MFIVPDSSFRDFSGMAAGGTPLAALQPRHEPKPGKKAHATYSFLPRNTRAWHDAKTVASRLNRKSDSFALPLSLASFVERPVLLVHYYRPSERTGAAARDLVLQPLQEEVTGGTSEPTRPTRNGVNFHNRNEIGCPRQS